MLDANKDNYIYVDQAETCLNLAGSGSCQIYFDFSFHELQNSALHFVCWALAVVCAPLYRDVKSDSSCILIHAASLHWHVTRRETRQLHFLSSPHRFETTKTIIQPSYF